MCNTTPLLPGLSPVSGKTVEAAFDGGSLTSDAGVLVLREVESGFKMALGRLPVGGSHISGAKRGKAASRPGKPSTSRSTTAISRRKAWPAGDAVVFDQWALRLPAALPLLCAFWSSGSVRYI